MIYQNIKFELNMKLYFLIDQKDSSRYNCVKIDFNNLIYINILLKIIIIIATIRLLITHYWLSNIICKINLNYV